MISQAMLNGLFEELTEMAKEKRAAFLLNAGPPIRFTGRTMWSNIGNALHAIANHPGQAFKAGIKETMKDVTTGHPLKRLGVGGLFALTTGSDVYNTLKKEDPTGQGRSRLARGAQAAGSFAGGMMGAPYGLSGGVVGGLTGEAAGRMVGKGIDRLRGRNKIPSPPNQMVEPPPRTNQ